MDARRVERLRATADLMGAHTLSLEEDNAVARREIGNQIVWLRRDLRAIIQGREVNVDLRKRCMDRLEEIHDIEKCMNLTEILADIEEDICRYNQQLDVSGKFAIHLLEAFELYGASIHDLAQVMGCNMRKVEKAYTKVIWRDELKRKEREHSIFVDLVCVANIELPVMRKKPASLFGYEWFMPFKEAMTWHMVSEFGRHPEFRNSLDDDAARIIPGLFEN